MRDLLFDLNKYAWHAD